MLTGRQADDLAEISADWPGYNVRCDGQQWTAECGRTLMVASSASHLRAMISDHHADLVFARTQSLLRLITY